MSQKVLIAMSGGVDSSVAALLLKEQGYEVVGAHMKLWDYVDVGADIYKDGRCCTIDSITDCRLVCDKIGAPFYVLNMSAHFRDSVIEDFVSEYHKGRTPNPCVQCNSDIKWNTFLKKARELGCDYMATGHYARIEQLKNRRWTIRKGVDSTRDQSYVLWGVSQDALANTLMPLGSLKKTEVRDIARKHELRTAEKAESREICFVVDDDYRRFLREYEEKRKERSFIPGDIVHEDGRVMGRHEGTEFFTIGQRKGLGLTHPTPLYVKEIDAENSRVIVSDNDSLFRDELIAEQINWVGFSPIVGRNPCGFDTGEASGSDSGARTFNADVKIRYLHIPSPAEIELLTDQSVRIKFIDKQRAITPGQSVAFYDGDILLGGGVIAG